MEANKRATKGTEHTLASSNKIGGEFKKEDLISDTRDEIHSKEYIEGKDIDRYQIKRIRYLEWKTERCPAKIARPTFLELYEHEKLLINAFGEIKSTYDSGRGMLHNNKIICAVPWINLKGVNNKSIAGSIKKYSSKKREEMEILSESVNLRYLLGILNSKYATTLLANIRGDDFNIYPEHIRNIPIPSATLAQQKLIADLVNKILKIK